MITGRSLATVVDRVTRILAIAETISEKFLVIAIMQDGCRSADAYEVLEHLVGKKLLARRGGALELTDWGRGLVSRIQGWREKHDGHPIMTVTWK